MMPSTGIMQPQGMLPPPGLGAFQGSMTSQGSFTEGAAPFQGIAPPDDSMEPAAVDGLLAYINGGEVTQENMEPLDEQTQDDDAGMQYSFDGDQYEDGGIAYQPAIDPALTQHESNEEWQRLMNQMQGLSDATEAQHDLTADADMQFLNALLSPSAPTNAPSFGNASNQHEQSADDINSQSGNDNGTGEPEWIAEQVVSGEQPGLPTSYPDCPFHHRATLCALPHGLPLTCHMDRQFCEQPHHNKIWCVEMLQEAEKAERMEFE